MGKKHAIVPVLHSTCNLQQGHGSYGCTKNVRAFALEGERDASCESFLAAGSRLAYHPPLSPARVSAHEKRGQIYF
jgi:hypothetical protein